VSITNLFGLYHEDAIDDYVKRCSHSSQDGEIQPWVLLDAVVTEYLSFDVRVMHGVYEKLDIRAIKRELSIGSPGTANKAKAALALTVPHLPLPRSVQNRRPRLTLRPTSSFNAAGSCSVMCKAGFRVACSQ
jgi:hypothetical protein